MTKYEKALKKILKNPNPVYEGVASLFWDEALIEASRVCKNDEDGLRILDLNTTVPEKEE